MSKDMMPMFELFQPTDLDGALDLADRYGSDAWKMAGGQDSLDWLKDRAKRTRAVIDLTRIAELKGIRETADGVVWQVHGDVADELLLLAYRVRPTTHRYTPTLRLPMLDAAARYHVQEVAQPHGQEAVWYHSSIPYFAALRQEGRACDGAWLAQAGLPLPRDLAETAFIARLTRI